MRITATVAMTSKNLGIFFLAALNKEQVPVWNEMAEATSRIGSDLRAGSDAKTSVTLKRGDSLPHAGRFRWIVMKRRLDDGHHAA